MPLAITDTRILFRPLRDDIVALLGALSDEDWQRPTMAGAWRVRDVVAHLVDTALRRLSFHRDGRTPPAPPHPFEGDRDLVRFINDLNAAWIRVADRLSPRVLTDLYAHAGTALADFIEGLDLNAAAHFPVSWAGQAGSPAWLDIGREFTEVWHHGAQIREAVGAPPFSDRRWLHAVIRIALHALPHGYRDVPAGPGQSMEIEITGPAGGVWTLHRRGAAWEIDEGRLGEPTAKAAMSDDTAWRLFFNGLSESAARQSIHLTGDVALGLPLSRVRSVIV